MAATKKPAKTSAKAPGADKAAVVVILTNRVCAHCGERIAINKIVTVENISFVLRDGRNKQMKTRLFFAVGHPQVVQA